MLTTHAPAGRLACPCQHSCRLSLQRRKDGPFPECAPTEHYFYIVRDAYVKGVDGGAEWDGSFLPGKYATLGDALHAVGHLHEAPRYVIEEHPRCTAFPPWSGHSDQARRKLSEEVTQEMASLTVGLVKQGGRACHAPATSRGRLRWIRR